MKPSANARSLATTMMGGEPTRKDGAAHSHIMHAAVEA